MEPVLPITLDQHPVQMVVYQVDSSFIRKGGVFEPVICGVTAANRRVLSLDCDAPRKLIAIPYHDELKYLKWHRFSITCSTLAPRKNRCCATLSNTACITSSSTRVMSVMFACLLHILLERRRWTLMLIFFVCYVLSRYDEFETQSRVPEGE